MAAAVARVVTRRRAAHAASSRGHRAARASSPSNGQAGSCSTRSVPSSAGSDMARVHQFVPTFEPGAVGAHVLIARRVLREAGYESEIFTGDVHPAFASKGAHCLPRLRAARVRAGRRQARVPPRDRFAGGRLPRRAPRAADRRPPQPHAVAVTSRAGSRSRPAACCGAGGNSTTSLRAPRSASAIPPSTPRSSSRRATNARRSSRSCFEPAVARRS